ncbi:MAG: DNA repair protein RecN [Paludibacteraceae bacterium]|nr:DNA repair protein RecN [Paludibacteraceae bacterium]MBR6686438.1 DNA repair protein RecN [Paludibacteraceae bacterium]
MLNSLHIENYVLIKKLDLNFESGFSVITGQTGAGKSILLGALNLVLGARADLKSIKEGSEKCIIEATFNISNYNLIDFFEENDLDYSTECILRRELSASGKSRLFINDTPVNASILRTLADQLIDVHSQHENLILRDNNFQLGVLDTTAKNQDLLDKYKSLYKSHQQISRNIEELESELSKGKEELDYLQFQYNQLEESKLVDSEDHDIETELTILEHANDIKYALLESENMLSAEQGVLEMLKTAENSLSAVSKYSTYCEEIVNRIYSCHIELKDIASELYNESEKVDSNPERLEYLRERRDLIYSLCQKHRVNTVSELIEIRNDLEERISLIDNSDEEIERLKRERDNLYKELLALANEISNRRQTQALEVEKSLVELLTALGMPNCEVKFSINPLASPISSGMDKVELLFSSNKNKSPQPIDKTASGGEISRVMLCLKYLLANSTSLPTLIFDEIDTGISGEAADLTAKMLKKMSTNVQIISISHLPQIAAKATTHYFVEKSGESETTVTQLAAEERVTAIARMLSGSTLSDAAIKNAQALLSEDN